MIGYYLALIGMTVVGSFASVQLKKASGAENISELIKNKYLYFGAFLYILASVLNIIALRRFDYSFVSPFSSVTYIWTMLFSYIFFRENITKRKIIGVILIVAGAVAISVGSIN